MMRQKNSDLKQFTSGTNHHFLVKVREHYITTESTFEATATNHVMRNEAIKMADHVITLWCRYVAVLPIFIERCDR